jgi:heptaprenyl diphosphate synthase
MTATEGQLGKPAGQDLAEGVYNLPALVAMQDPHYGEELRSLLGRPLDDDAREQARQLVVKTDGIAATLRAAEKFVDEANSALALIGDDSLTRGFSQLLRDLLVDLPVATSN